MKSIISLATAALIGLSSSTPVPDTTTATPGPYHISGFFASKPHLSSGCHFEFNLTAPSLPGPDPVYCWASVELGFSGATWLGYVYQGLGRCTSDRVAWTFNHPRGAETDRNDAVFNVTVDGVRGTYRVPKEDIYVNLNDERNPFDNDVSYAGPGEFEVGEFPEGE
ncbi:hypothetical protein QBC41DRAFT_272947 [Cercophora samala]|uniref:Uncharacterized protein n=1 Tax=Cercophora samala TaxID=330535 RepID=A0AA39ZFX2_9PEZI|nr:hypothetical protein QBC41DRAFT_272947 [Cercophora samala]